MQLQLDQVQPGGRLGHRVLDLQPGVDLHELEAAGGGIDQEFHGARIAVARRGAQSDGRVTDRLFLRGVEHRRRRLLEDLLMAALQAAVSDAGRPRGAVAVGDDLHLHMAGSRHQLLEEDRGVAERQRRLGAVPMAARPRVRRRRGLSGSRARRRLRRP